jgi:DNA polymerase-4
LAYPDLRATDLWCRNLRLETEQKFGILRLRITIMPPPARIILHVDMDAFFAQAEVLAAPSLRGKPLIIGGRPGKRGVVATASYEARPFGIRSGMSLTEAARRCPNAVFLPCHPNRYFDLSARILNRLLRHTPLVEMASIDEAYLDATHQVAALSEGERLAHTIQQDLQRSLSLTCSVGIGPSKLIAKMAAGMRKPAGRTMLEQQDFLDHFSSKPVTTLYGVGRATAEALSRCGIATVEDLGKAPDHVLRNLLGIWGPVLGAAARGEDASPVIPHHARPDPKSLGHEYTLPVDESDPQILRRWLLGICEEVGSDLREEDRVGETIHLKVRWTDFSLCSRQQRLAEPTSSTRRIYRVAKFLLNRLGNRRAVRLLGVSVSGLKPCTGGSIADLFDDPKLDAFDRAADRIRQRYGRRIIRRAALLQEKRR